MVYSDFENYESDSDSVSSLELDDEPLTGGARRSRGGIMTGAAKKSKGGMMTGAAKKSKGGMMTGAANLAKLLGLTQAMGKKKKEKEDVEGGAKKRRGRPRKSKKKMEEMEEMSEEEEGVEGGCGCGGAMLSRTYKGGKSMLGRTKKEAEGGLLVGASSGRTRPRAPSQQMLNTKYDRAVFRAEQMPNMGVKKGGFVHRPAQYRGVGAGVGSTGAGEYADALTSAGMGGMLERSVGAGRKKKAVKKTDGRAKRAQIVKQVMKQRGVSLVEASKIVKNEGLY